MRICFFIDTLEEGWIFGLSFTHLKVNCEEGLEDHRREVALCFGKFSIGIMFAYHKREMQEEYDSF